MMDIFEFELRYRAYGGLLRFFGDEVNDDLLQHYIQRTDHGVLSTKLTETSLETLWDLTRQTYTSWKKELIEASASHVWKGKTKADYLERLEYELKVIYEMGYNTYFLVVRDYIIRAKTNAIMVGPGRGSVAGSLLSFVLGITALDPLEYDLIFERFLNPGRISMPDIDTDFEDTQRDKVIDYIRQKYGTENVAHIGTYMTLAAKAAFKDVARVMGIKFDQANKLTTLITEKTVELSVEKNKELQDALKSDTRLQKVIDTAMALEGTVRQTGVHACGMIIAPAPVVTYSPIQYPPKPGSKGMRDESRIVSQYEGPVIEHLGLLKMDILGLRNLGIIKHTAKILHARAKLTGQPLPLLIEDILSTMTFTPPPDDPLAYEIFAQGDTSGVFQFESDGMRTWLKKLKPNCFDDLIAMVSLYRPGPMEYIPHYIERKFGKEQVSYMDSELEALLVRVYGEETAEEQKAKLFEDLDPFLRGTYGIPVYQEQLMRLVQAMAGFSMSEADNLRKGVGKKIREVIEKIKIEFVKKAEQYRGYKPETSNRIYEKMIEPAADYSFNKSHGACYAFISYQTAWLKAHYPLEFHAALLRSVEQEPDKLAGFIQEIQLQGIDIYPPRVTSSFEHVGVVESHLEIGFLGIKGVGSEVAAHIESERTTQGQYTSLADFLTRCASFLNKKSIESLVKAGALDERGTREQLVEAIPQMVERCKQQGSSSGGLFGGGLFGAQDFPLPQVPKTDPLFTLRMEKEVFNVAVSRHPFDGLYPWCKQKYNFISAMQKENYGEFHICAVVLGLNRGMRGGRFLQLEDISGQTEFYFLEKVDLEPFDIVAISGYRGQRFPKADCIRVLSYEKLFEKAKRAGLYDAQQTVSFVRRTRKGEIIPVGGGNRENGEVGGNGENVENVEVAEIAEIAEIAEKNEGGSVFELPDNAFLLQQIVQVTRTYAGAIPVHIGSMKFSLTQEGIIHLRKILEK